MTICALYSKLKSDPRLQRDWETNQPRVDRALEALLIARTSREVATAALFAIKLKFEPSAASFVGFESDGELLDFARRQGSGGSRLANILSGKTLANDIARAAAYHSLVFYRCRSEASNLLRMGWSDGALRSIVLCPIDQLLNPALLPYNAKLKAQGLGPLADLLARRESTLRSTLRDRLRDIPGLGAERADAVGLFGFGQPWPITDTALWHILSQHGVLTNKKAAIKSYQCRGAAFAPYWEQLCGAFSDDFSELAATLYLWTNEAKRLGYRYC